MIAAAKEMSPAAGLIIGPICLIIGTLVLATVFSSRWRAHALQPSTDKRPYNPVGAFGFGSAFLGFGVLALGSVFKIQMLPRIGNAFVIAGFLTLILNSIFYPIVRRILERRRSNTLLNPHYLLTWTIWVLFGLTIACMFAEANPSPERVKLVAGGFWFFLIAGILDAIVRIIRKPLTPETDYTLEIRARFKGSNAHSRQEVEDFLKTLKDFGVTESSEEGVFCFKDENGGEVTVIVDSKSDPDENIIHEVTVMGCVSRQMYKFCSETAKRLGWDIYDSAKTSWHTPAELLLMSSKPVSSHAGSGGQTQKFIAVWLLVVLLGSLLARRFFGLSASGVFFIFGIPVVLLIFSTRYVVSMLKTFFEELSRPKKERTSIVGMIFLLLIAGTFAFVIVVIVWGVVRHLISPH